MVSDVMRAETGWAIGKEFELFVYRNVDLNNKA